MGDVSGVCHRDSACAAYFVYEWQNTCRSVQSAAFNLIVVAIGNYHKKMIAEQKCTADKQTNCLFNFVLSLRFLLIFFFSFHLQVKPQMHKNALFFFFKRLTISFPSVSKTKNEWWKSQSSWHELFVAYFPRGGQLQVTAVMCWGEGTGGFRSNTASRHNLLPDRSVEFSLDQVPWCTGAVRGAEPALVRPSLALWELSVVLKATPRGPYLELSRVLFYDRWGCPWCWATGAGAVRGPAVQGRFWDCPWLLFYNRWGCPWAPELSVVLQFRAFVELSRVLFYNRWGCPWGWATGAGAVRGPAV